MQFTSCLPPSVYTAEQARAIDNDAIASGGISAGYTLMCRAGEAAFAVLRQRWPQARNIIIVCGSGNNGGDGFVLARLARQAGLQLSVLTIRDPHELRGDAARAYHAALANSVSIESFDPARLKPCDVIVDAIFGIGLNRDVSGDWQQAINAINHQRAPVLALDIPSGLQADTGAVLGSAINAAVTLSFIVIKQGLITGEGPACCGELLFAGLGLDAGLIAPYPPAATVYQTRNVNTQLAPRSRSAHKGHFGHVLILGGDYGMAGAVRLSAEAACRCGAGLSSVGTRTPHAIAHAAQRPEIMFCGLEQPGMLERLLARATVVAIGPGLGQSHWARCLWQRLARVDKPLVVDADGLNLLATRPFRRDDWVLTPHPGEAARLLGCEVSDIQSDRYRAVRELQARYGGVVVLKGAGTLINGPDPQPPVVCRAGNPGMASGGMGDVLTGIIAALIAQHLAPLSAAASAVYLHATAADQAARAEGERGLLASDLLAHLRTLVNP